MEIPAENAIIKYKYINKKVNKFQQVSSLDHQISLAGSGAATRGGGSWYNEVPCLGRGRVRAGESLHGGVQCIMGIGHMGPP